MRVDVRGRQAPTQLHIVDSTRGLFVRDGRRQSSTILRGNEKPGACRILPGRRVVGPPIRLRLASSLATELSIVLIFFILGILFCLLARCGETRAREKGDADSAAPDE